MDVIFSIFASLRSNLGFCNDSEPLALMALMDTADLLDNCNPTHQMERVTCPWGIFHMSIWKISSRQSACREARFEKNFRGGRLSQSIRANHFSLLQMVIVQRYHSLACSSLSVWPQLNLDPGYHLFLRKGHFTLQICL